MIHPHFAVFTHASLPRQSGMAFHSGRCILHPDVTTPAAMPFGGRMSSVRLRLSSISSRLEFRSEAEVTRPANSDRRLPSICIEHVPLPSLACPSKFRPNYPTMSSLPVFIWRFSSVPSKSSGCHEIGCTKDGKEANLVLARRARHFRLTNMPLFKRVIS